MSTGMNQSETSGEAAPGQARNKVIPLSTRKPRASMRKVENLRVVYVVSLFPIWSETFIVREIHALLKAGVDVRIVSLRRPAKDVMVQDDARLLLDRVIYPRSWLSGLSVLMTEMVRNPRRTVGEALLITGSMWKTPLSLAKTLVTWFRSIGLADDIRALEPDHLHAHWATYPSTAAMLLADRLQRPFSITAHAHDIYLEDHLMAQKLKSARFIATISEYNRRYLRQRYPSARHARIDIVHCGVPPLDELPERKRGRPDVPLLLSVGRHDEVKGFPSLLKACHLLKSRGRKFRCEIIGDGPLRNDIETLLKQLELEDAVQLLGVQPGTVVAEKLREADVFVLASERASNGNMDGIPVALMEAMQMGTPVVSTAISGIPELVENGGTGLLVPPRTPEALADALDRMLGEAMLRERCVAGAKRRVSQEFDAATEAGKLLNIIRSCAGEGNAKKVADHH